MTNKEMIQGLKESLKEDKSLSVPDFITEHQDTRRRKYQKKLADIVSFKKQKKVDTILTVGIGAFIIILTVLLLLYTDKSYSKMFEKCDAVKGYQCSYYDARNLELKGE